MFFLLIYVKVAFQIKRCAVQRISIFTSIAFNAVIRGLSAEAVIVPEGKNDSEMEIALNLWCHKR